MDKAAALAQLEKWEKSINSPTLPQSAKDQFRKKADALKAEIEKQETESKGDAKKELEDSIAKFEKSVNSASLPESAKGAYRTKLAAAKEKLAELDKAETPAQVETAVEKVEVATENVEAATEQVEKKIEKVEAAAEPAAAEKKTGKKRGRPAASGGHSSGVRKPAAKKEKKKKEKQKKEKKKQGTKKVAQMLSDLRQLVNSDKKLKGAYSNTSEDNLHKDAARPAIRPGKRVSKEGNVYYENRANRADVRKNRKRYPMLEDGGQLSGGDVIGAGTTGDLKVGAGMFAKGGMTKASILKKYEKLEDNNDHTEAALLLVKTFGTADEVEKIKEIQQRSNKAGHTTAEDIKERFEISNKYYKKLFKDGGDIADGDEIKGAGKFAKGGGVSEGFTNPDMYARGGEVHRLEMDTDEGTDGAGSFKKGGRTQNPPQSASYTKAADKKELGKPVGHRWTDAGAKKLGKRVGAAPSVADIEKYSGKSFKDRSREEHRYLYSESRKDKSDMSRRKRFDMGGEFDAGAGMFKKGGAVKQNPPQSASYTKAADKQEKAKPVGWRWTTQGAKKLGHAEGAKPSAADIEKYKDKKLPFGKRYLYEEARKDKSDKKRRQKL